MNILLESTFFKRSLYIYKGIFYRCSAIFRHCPDFCKNFSKSIGNTIRLNITHEVWFGNIHKTLVRARRMHP